MSDKWIFFDCFGVILNDPFTRWDTDFNLTQQQCKDLREKVFNPVDSGQITTVQAMRRFANIIQRPVGQFIEESWFSKTVVNEKLVDWIKQNSDKYHIVLLSNAAPFYVDPLFERFGVHLIFEKLFISSDLHMAKPDPAIFRYALKECDCKPQNAIMIDDRAANIRGAKKAGMHGIVFHDTESTIKRINEIFEN